MVPETRDRPLRCRVRPTPKSPLGHTPTCATTGKWGNKTPVKDLPRGWSFLFGRRVYGVVDWYDLSVGDAGSPL